MEIEISMFQSLITTELKELSKLFKEKGYEIRLVGGAVRDLLLKKRPADLDFATNATPADMKRIFDDKGYKVINNNGEEHGTVTVLIDRVTYEITTLRVDVVTDGRHAEVEFTEDWELDAGRRDLTINSMFLGLDGSHGTLYDYFNGVEDLKKRRVAFVGEADKRMQEDYLRILRYFRFYGKIAENADSHNQATLDAIRRNVGGLRQISGERIWSELRKILTGNFAGDLFKKLLECGCGPYIGFPEDFDASELELIWSRLKNKKYEAMTLGVSIFRSINELNHLKDRLKLPGADRDLGIFLILNRGIKSDPENHLRPYQFLLADSKPEKNILELMKYKGDDNLLEAFQQWELPTFPVDGKLLTEKNIPKDKRMGKVMDKLKKIWKQSDFKLTRAELEKKIPEVYKDVCDQLGGGDRAAEKTKIQF